MVQLCHHCSSKALRTQPVEGRTQDLACSTKIRDLSTEGLLMVNRSDPSDQVGGEIIFSRKSEESRSRLIESPSPLSQHCSPISDNRYELEISRSHGALGPVSRVSIVADGPFQAQAKSARIAASTGCARENHQKCMSSARAAVPSTPKLIMRIRSVKQTVVIMMRWMRCPAVKVVLMIPNHVLKR